MAVGVAVASATIIAVGEGLTRGGCAPVDVIVARRYAGADVACLAAVLVFESAVAAIARAMIT